MDHAIACLERELATLANNFAVTADTIARGTPEEQRDPDADKQQDSRWNQMEGIRRGIASLRYANQRQGTAQPASVYMDLNQATGARNAQA